MYFFQILLPCLKNSIALYNRREQWNTRLSMSGESSSALKCLPTSSISLQLLFSCWKSGWSGGVVAIFYIPFAAFCSCCLWFCICLYQGLEMHMGELNDVILGVLGRTVCQAQIATGCLLWVPVLHHWLLFLWVCVWFNLYDQLKSVHGENGSAEGEKRVRRDGW